MTAGTRIVWSAATLLVLSAGLFGLSLAQESQEQKTASAGHFRPWTPYAGAGVRYSDGRYVIRPSPNGRWVASTGWEQGDRNVFALWAVGPSGELLEQLPNPFPKDHGVVAFAWCGENLAICEGEGFDRFPTFEDEKNIDRASLIVYNPAARTIVATSKGFAFLLAGDVRGERLMAISIGESDRAVVAYRIPDLHPIAESQVASEVNERTTRLALWPLGWDGVSGGWYALDDRTAVRRGMRSRTRMLSFLKDGRSLVDLGEIGSSYKPLASPWETPAVTLLKNNAGVIGLLQPLDAMPSIRIYGPQGLLKSYDLQSSEALPERVNVLLRSGGYSVIAGARDGEHVVLQEMRHDREGKPTVDAAPVWYLDLVHNRAQEVATTGMVDQCFGWLSDDALIVRATRVGSANGPAGHDYGVLALGASGAESGG